MDLGGRRLGVFFAEMVKRLKHYTQEPKLGEYFLQRIALDVQRGNAAAVLGTPRQLPTLHLF